MRPYAEPARPFILPKKKYEPQELLVRLGVVQRLGISSGSRSNSSSVGTMPTMNSEAFSSGPKGCDDTGNDHATGCAAKPCSR